jgi:hypothetical protein
MRRTILIALAVATTSWGCVDETPTTTPNPDAALAATGTALDHSSNRMDIAVIGDVPYGPVATEAYPAFIESIDADPKVRRVVHVGDIKSGSTVCSDAWFDYIRESFDSFEDPLVYTPGDNEWTDCHRPNNGAYDPLERLAQLREVFFDRPGSTLGARPKRVLAQAGYPENQLWMESRVVFVPIHEVGSNNSLAPWTGFAAPTAAQLAEYTARDAANRAWLNEAFDLAGAQSAEGVVVFTQADMFDPFSTPATVTGHQAFIQLLAQRSASFARPVMLIVGDSHVYREFKPLVGTSAYGTFDVPNLTQITVEQSLRDRVGEWLRLTVDPGSPEVFSWERVR